jgi:hypothetical protein
MIRIQPRSVRVRLTLWYIGVMLVVLGVYAGAVYAFVHDNSSQLLDERLHDDFDWASDMLAQRPDGSIAPYDETGEGARSGLQVYSLEGDLLYDTPERAGIQASSDKLAAIADANGSSLFQGQSPSRVMSGGVKDQRQAGRGSGRPIRVLDHSGPTSMCSSLLLGLPIAVAAAGIGGYCFSRAAPSLRSIEWPSARARSMPNGWLTGCLSIIRR